MFTNLRMVNFKSWKDTGDVRLAPLTVLFGGNSTGKSGLLQMLLLFKQTTESRDRNIVLQTGTDDPRSYVELGTPSEITHFDKKSMDLTVGWEWPKREDALVFPVPRKQGESISLNSLEFSTTIHADGNNSYVSAFSYCQGRNEGQEVEISLNQESGSEYSFDVRLGGLLAQRRQARPFKYMKSGKFYSIPFEGWMNYRSPSYLLDLEWEFIRQFQRVYHLGPLREFPQRIYRWSGERPTDVGTRGQRAIQAILSEKLQKDILRRLKKLGLAEAFSVRPLVRGSVLYEVRIRRHLQGQEVLLPDVGLGVSQVLPVLVLCLYAEKHSTIILEHPDLHLHPYSQAALADFLVDVSQKRNVQLIIESHSEHLLRRLQRRTAEEKLRPPHEVALYFCDIEDGISRIEELNLDVFGRISNWPDDFFGDMDGDILEVLDKGLGKKIAANA